MRILLKQKYKETEKTNEEIAQNEIRSHQLE